jgi:hypothetical protein
VILSSESLLDQVSMAEMSPGRRFWARDGFWSNEAFHIASWQLQMFAVSRVATQVAFSRSHAGPGVSNASAAHRQLENGFAQPEPCQQLLLLRAQLLACSLVATHTAFYPPRAGSGDLNASAAHRQLENGFDQRAYDEQKLTLMRLFPVSASAPAQQPKQQQIRRAQAPTGNVGLRRSRGGFVRG